ncbi:MAG: gliding motility-associated C-terminal domain-containing protein [Flavobacteriales bacterium]|nr:gliding motility-associated C-terminal domain-containing protein [Flavobacteriales bacterium]
MPRVLILIMILFLGLNSIRATHIVGGDFYYEYLGNDDYKITMKLYIDCYNGNPGAIESDQYAIFGIFDGNNKLVTTREVERKPGVKLSGAVYKCIVNPGDVCVERYNYEFVINLPKKAGGYTIAFQRCCRNNTIKNIVDAPGTGATYWVKIPDRTDVPIDNSPIFKKFPPIYVCNTFPLVFDHSATDKDGDSLSYELYKPYNGADKNMPRPSVPSNPPFANIWWLPGYGTDNQMKGAPILTIDPVTGELTVTPNLLGQFVIGVKVIEWRNGQIIGETLRDYQFNVVDCKAIAVANFEAKVVCSDTVFFKDKSLGTTTLTWDFGDPASGFDNNQSLEKNPYHVYSGDGDFIVKLRAWNPACEDEYNLKVKIRTPKSVDLGRDNIFCKPINEQLAVKYVDYTDILWSTGAKTASIIIKDPGKYWVRATYGLCKYSDTINLNMDPISYTKTPDSLFCDKVDALMKITNRSKNAKILWALGDTSASVKVNKEGSYPFVVYNNNCQQKDTIKFVLARITPNLGPDLFICNDFLHTLDAGPVQQGASYLWNDGSNNRLLTTSSAGTFWVKTTLKHCEKFDTMEIRNSVVSVTLGPDKHFCDSFSIVLDAGPANPGGTASYLWNNGVTTQTNHIADEGKHWVQKTDNFGCVNSDTIFINVTESPIVSLGKDTVVICVRAPIRLFAQDGFSEYLWQDGYSEKERMVELPGKYHITVTDEIGCKGSDTIIVKTDPNLLPNHIFIPNAFTPNGDGLNDVFPFDDPVLQSDYHLRIFNRWGEKVYDSDTNREPWDGKTRASDSQLDAYIWIAYYKGCDGNPKTDKGTVTIVR